MGNFDKAIKAMIKGNKYLIKNIVKNAPFDKTVNGLVKNVNEDGTYDVEINGSINYSLSCINGIVLNKNQVVKVRIPQNQKSQQYIEGYI